ncbi:Testosterone 17-beta-dehydrogenase 3,Inactive hydroxysteroid dehydrogenase-like protein 1,Muskelin [Lepeophtheirus salmonis]|uniref:Testosterone 17-beta-dehydrogenase 3,Inactive hydroxysteroid dehydrogenase-like protein 1,Muskelin n=1 Tax=Lepeophtheirus salmonis TaxID=72036 RepID=A0A7R8H3A9_LEPSM|nr:Testosterone 17-beta-dehydrogenase 3,Inactive hydroxysteroid dehydrogenase-like protein 1,Muskelin [Lepeophtheirus salmonis]CAF2826737.1 Testosterone 17-beta-dehydrogenase 3,Inactive hydroxysteroid dehydrogenase-like protein 1,Muskelin [Lepeophtheirus salmonis]
MALVIKKGDIFIDNIVKCLRDSSLSQYFALFGASTIVYIAGKTVFQLMNGIRIHFWSRFRRVNLKESFGTWAIVTGCTSGIGRALSLELASRGMNVVLIARNLTHLNELSEYLEKNYEIQTLIIAVDFKDIGIYEVIREKLKPIENNLGILINNVAMVQDVPTYYTKISDTCIIDSINTNITSISLMSKIALQSMVKRRRGAILNVSSLSGVYATPLISIYSATKAFVNHFSRNLALEYRPKGIHVQNLIPMSVKTKMFKNIWDDDTVKSVVTSTTDVYAYNAISTLSRTYQTSGYWRHSLAQWFIFLLPSSLVEHKIHSIMRSSMNTWLNLHAKKTEHYTISIILIMALVVEKADLLVNEIFKGIRNSSITQYSALLGGSVVAYTVGKFLYQLVDGIRIHFWSRLCRINLKEKYGDWAIVTGCTSGIGRAITIELASRGINLALIARNPTFLKDLSEYIENEFKVKTLVIKVDFKDTGIYEDIRDQLKPIENELGMLFNNVGVTLEQIEEYTITQNSSILDVININISSMALMSKIGMEMMETRRRFVNHFSRNIYYECRQKGISVQNLVPMGVRTNMLKKFREDNDIGSTWTTPTSEVYAYNAINTVGRTFQTSGYWGHSLIQWFFGAFPLSVFESSMYARLRNKFVKKNNSVYKNADLKANFSSSIHKYSSSSSTYTPENILDDKPKDQSSRWSSNTISPPQFLILKLERPAIVKFILFGKYEKTHVCNLKRFKVFGGIREDDNFIELLDSGLKNDSIPESFPTSIYGESTFLPLLKSYNHLSYGKNNLGKRRQSDCALSIFDSIIISKYMNYFRKKTLIKLENEILTNLHDILVSSGNFVMAESIIDKAIHGRKGKNICGGGLIGFSN